MYRLVEKILSYIHYTVQVIEFKNRDINDKSYLIVVKYKSVMAQNRNTQSIYFIHIVLCFFYT